VVAVRDHRVLLGDALLVVVTFSGDPSRLAAYRHHLGLETAGVPVVSDLGRDLYRLLGARRGRLHRVWSPGTLAMYARLVRQGRRLQRPREDTRQLGGDAVVDHTGRLHRVWLPEGPDRRPAIAEIVTAVRHLDPR
jgi:hypothetical protein